MGTDFTFAYGSNMNSSDLRSWLERNGYNSALIVDRRPAVLEGYDFVWNYHSRGRGGGAANLERRENSRVYGLVVEFEEPLLKAFDRKEGHPLFYSRGEKRIRVKRLDNDEIVEAWLYIANPNRGDSRDIRPTRAYKKIILDGAREYGLPEEFIDKLEEWPTQD
jgi:gamma-glutamylcyclotransferase (GGCT)/AIG2-like uncharacterized protein YtfP